MVGLQLCPVHIWYMLFTPALDSTLLVPRN
jgi:hypothetical protein